MEQTICAISTAIGESGIGIVRISGKNALEIGQKIFLPVTDIKREHRKLQYGWIVNKEGQKVDEVLFVEMFSPNTYTKEDMVEVYTHGGVISTKRVLECILKNKDIRLAEPGEFTKRAFLNGRIDLVQAEAVIDLIKAKTEQEHKTSMNQLQGRLTEEIEELSQEMLSLLAHVEMIINFTEDLEDEIDTSLIGVKIQNILERVNKILSTKNHGKILRDGIETTILGKPNVGKSSLMNALLKENRAIVTDIPGTTRDIIQEYINLDGILLKINDTAGIRETSDIVEKIGVDKTIELLDKTDLILLLLDQSTGVTAEDKEILDLINQKPVIVLLNKIDIDDKIAKEEILKKLPHAYIIKSSMTEKKGLEELVKYISEIFEAGKLQKESVILTNVRQIHLLEEARKELEMALEDYNHQVSIDCIDVSLKAAWEKLGEITGENISEDIIDKIFADFCIGK